MPDVKQYMEGLLKTAGVAPERQQALMDILSDEQVAKAFDEELQKPRLRQDEFSRKMDEYSRKEKDLNDWYQKELVEYNKTLSLQTQYEQELAKLGQQPPAGNQNLVQTPADVITKADFEARFKQYEQNTLSLMKGVGDITADYVTRFGKKPDLNQIEEIAVKNGLSLQEAYSRYTQPLVEEQSKAQREKELAEAKLQGAREALSKHNLPVEAKPREHHVIFDRQQTNTPPANGRADERTLRSNFVEEWNKAGMTTSG